MPKVFALPRDAYIVVVTGDRKWTDKETIRNELLALPLGTIIVHGDARGADILAKEVATSLGLQTLPCPAHWKHNSPRWCLVYGVCPADCPEVEGNAAGPIRNCWMLDTYHPAFVLAFHAHIDASRGTKHCIASAKKRKIPGKLVAVTGVVEHW